MSEGVILGDSDADLEPGDVVVTTRAEPEELLTYTASMKLSAQQTALLRKHGALGPDGKFTPAFADNVGRQLADELWRRMQNGFARALFGGIHRIDRRGRHWFKP